MRVGFVRNVGLHITALAVLGLGACNDNPVDFDVKQTTRVTVNPSFMVVAAGRTSKLESRAVNEGNEPTFDEVSWAIDPTCGSGAITVADDPDWLPEIQPPGFFEVTGGATLGPTCINLSSGSASAQVEVVVVVDGIQITAPVPDEVFRAGATGQIVAQLIDFDGNPVTPYDPVDAVFASSDSDVATIDDDVGNFTTTTSGAATLSATWAGQEANGTAGLGVVRQDQVTIQVIANVAVAAAFESDPLGAFLVGDVDEFPVIVVDAVGNQNTIPDDITAVTAQSSDEAVATVTWRIATDDAAYGQGDVPVVEVTAVGGGTTTISGVVQTTNGDLPFSAVYYVPVPVITALSVASGGFAETVTITGEQLQFPGLITAVTADGYLLGNFTVVSDTEITAQMPTYTEPGDHEIMVIVAGVLSNTTTWSQTNSCNALDFPENPGWDGPFVDVSLPLWCNGTASGPQDDWFFTPVSTDALLGETSMDVTLAPTWGPPLKDIDFYWCETDDVFACHFEIDQPPETATVTIGVGNNVWVMDDFAGFDGDLTPQDYTIIVTTATMP
jgi:hypothetical protein